MTGRCTGGQHHPPVDGGHCPCGAVSRHPVAVPVRAGDEEIVAALAEALEDQFSYATSYATVIVDWDEEAAALLPVVRRLAEQRAAEELRAVAERFDRLFYDGEAQYADQPESHMKSCALGRNIAYRRAAIRLEARAAALGGKP